MPTPVLSGTHAGVGLQRGTPAWLLVEHFKNHPEDVLDRAATAARMRISGAGVDGAAGRAVQAGLVMCETDPILGRVWRAGPALVGASRAEPERVEGSAGDAEPAAAAPAQVKPRKRRYDRLPRLDPSQFQPVTGVPIPSTDAACRKGVSVWDVFLDKLTQDGQALLDFPIQYRGALQKAIFTYMRNRPELSKVSRLKLRTTSDTTCGVWREAVKPGQR